MFRRFGGDARRPTAAASSAVALLCAGVSTPALAQSAGPNPPLDQPTAAQAAATTPSSSPPLAIHQLDPKSYPPTSTQAKAGRIPAPPPLTWHGITVYGTVDAGLAYMNHGAPLSTTYGPGLPFVIQKYSNRSTFSAFDSGLSQSKLGVAIEEPLVGDVSLVGRVETGFNPTSGRLFDAERSLVKNNGRALTQDITAGDSARDGQFDQGLGYFGVSSKTFGTLTYGRQYGLIQENLYTYDPQAQSEAFDLIGYTLVAGGGGDTEDSRLDRSIKYAVSYGPAHLALLHQFRDGGSIPGGADEADIGGQLGGLSVDAVWTQVHDGIAAASLTAAQNAVAPGTLAATVSDNTAYALMAKYTRGPFRVYGGWEHITYANPSNPISDGAQNIGGYTLSYVTNTAFDHHKELQIAWFGVRYYATNRLSVTGAWYHYDQSSYGTTSCTNASAATCSGTEDQVSLVADYRLSPRWDVYSGVESSWVANGLASGFLQVSEISPAAGVRFNF